MRVCTRCVLDTTDLEITFDKHGWCNHCRDYLIHETRDFGHGIPIEALQGEKCMIGLSGGLDSSYAFHMAMKFGLNPTVVVVPTIWDRQIATRNIARMIGYYEKAAVLRKYNEDVYHALQWAFLKASVPNAEIPSDHLIVALLTQYAVEHDIKWIIHGGNVVTEQIMPRAWGYEAKDWFHIKAVFEAMGGGVKFLEREFPHITLGQWVTNTFIRKIKWFPILNQVPYNILQAADTLHNLCGWQGYGEKHQESVYTRWFQGCYLPKKFGIDKRKAHFSNLIMSGQMKRGEALMQLDTEIPGYGMEQMHHDSAKIRTHFGVSVNQWHNMLHAQPRKHSDYSYPLWDRMQRVRGVIRNIATGRQ